MADTLFQNGTVILPAWLNDVNRAVYNSLTTVAGSNTITASGPQGFTGLFTGQVFWFFPQATNTGAVTLNVSGLGARPVTKAGSVALVAGDLITSAAAQVYFDGTRYQLVNPQNIVASSVAAANIIGQVAIANGGTGAADAPTARTNLGVAASGVNADIASLTGLTTPLSVVQGGTGDNGSAWTSRSIGAITSTTGSITSANGTVRYKSIGKTVFFTLIVNLVNNGTGTGGFNIASVFAVAPFADVIVIGRETAATGTIVQLSVSPSNSGSIFNASNAYPGATGATFKFSGVYESV